MKKKSLVDRYVSGVKARAKNAVNAWSFFIPGVGVVTEELKNAYAKMSKSDRSKLAGIKTRKGKIDFISEFIDFI